MKFAKIFYRNFLFVILLCSSSFLLGQANTCDEILEKQIDLVDDSKSFPIEDIKVLEKCGYKFDKVPSSIVSIALIDMISSSEPLTYGTLIKKIEEVENSPVYHSARKDAMIMFLCKAGFIGIILILVIFWGRIVFQQFSKQKEEEILDQIN